MSRSLVGPTPHSQDRHRGRSPQRRAARRLVLAGFVAVLGMVSLPSLAFAEFRLCNRTQSRIGVAVGYKDGDVWMTEGWWNVAANTCETLLRGDLQARFYYLYALDYDQGGEWTGKAYMCTREKEFTIRGGEDCLARGFERTGFFEVDTKEQKGWTVQLTGSTETRPSLGTVPMPLPNSVRGKSP